MPSNYASVFYALATVLDGNISASAWNENWAVGSARRGKCYALESLAVTSSFITTGTLTPTCGVICVVVTHKSPIRCFLRYRGCVEIDQRHAA